MEKDYYNLNIEGYYHYIQIMSEISFKMLKDEINLHTYTYCINDNQINEYYFKEFEKTKKKLKDYSDLNIRHLFEMSFENDNIKIDKKRFVEFANNHLKVQKHPVFKKLSESTQIEKNYFNSMNKKEFATYFSVLLKDIDFINAELNLRLSLKLNYFKHLLSDHKENEVDKIKTKEIPKFDLYQRYLVLTSKTETIDQINKLLISSKSKHKILAIILNCSIDNAKHLFNNSYQNKLKNISNKEDTVKEYLDTLK